MHIKKLHIFPIKSIKKITVLLSALALAALLFTAGCGSTTGSGDGMEGALDWFAENARKLMFRENPQPYYVWVSEIMLQQTRVEAVKEYFARFIKELPDIRALACVQEEKLLKLWEGLAPG